MTKLNEMVFDLERFTICLSFIEGFKDTTTQLTVSFRPTRANTPSRFFYFSFIAFLVHKMKSEKKVRFFKVVEGALEKNLKEVSFLDKKLCGKQSSKSYKSLQNKIVRWWPDRIKSLAEARSFKILGGLSKQKQLDVYEGTKKQDIWFRLFQRFEDNRHLIKFAIDDPEIDITLDQIKFIYKGINNNDELAWKEFIKGLDSNVDDMNLSQEASKNVDEVLLFLQDIEERFNYINIFNKQFFIDNQYIPINVTLERIFKHEIESFFSYTEAEFDHKHAYAFKGFDEDNRRTVTWDEIKDNYRNIMVLADPGMGKSTLLMREARIRAQFDIDKLKYKSVNEVVFPIFIRLYDLCQSGEEIYDLIIKIVSRDYPQTAEPIIKLLQEKLREGKCILLLDALDEVPYNNRRNLSVRMERFVRNNKCKLIVTSRIVGYESSFISGIKELEIVPFTKKQIEKYVQFWFNSNAQNTISIQDSANNVIAELQNKPQLLGLAQNPLLLSLICNLSIENNYFLPNRKIEVYRQAVDCLLLKWTRKPQTIGKVHAKKRLLEEISFIYCSESKQIFSLSDLYDKIENYLKKSRITDFLNSTTSDIIKEISEDDGLIVSLDKDALETRYIFIHRTFQEYLAASYLNRMYTKDKEVCMAIVRQNLWEFHWHDVFTLLAGLLINPKAMIDMIENEEDDIFANLLLLCGRCIIECGKTHHHQFYHIFEKLLSLWYSSPMSEIIEPLIISLGRVNRYILNRLSEKILKEEIEGEKIIRVLAKIGNEEAFLILTNTLKNRNKSLRVCAAMELHEFKSPSNAKYLIELFKECKDLEVKRQLAITIGIIGNACAVDVFLENIEKITQKSFNEDDESLLESIVCALGYLKSKKALGPVLKLLDRLWGAPEALANIGGKETVTLLIKTIKEENYVMTRVGAITALKKLGNKSKKTVKVLLDLLNYEDEVHKINFDHLPKDDWAYVFSDLYRLIRYEAARALGEIKCNDAIIPMSKLLKSSDVILRRNITNALGIIGEESCVPFLIKALEDTDNDVRSSAAFYLGEIGHESVIDHLLIVARDKSRGPRERAIEALSKIDKNNSLDILIEGLYDESPKSRAYFAYLLGEKGDIRAGKYLLKSLKEGDSELKIHSVKAIGKIGFAESAEELVSYLKDDQKLREPTTDTLKKIGTINTLKRILSDPEIDIYDPDIFSLIENTFFKI